MKANNIISIVAVAALSVACNQIAVESPVAEQEQEMITITAVAGDCDAETKTERQLDGSVFWKPLDEISLFYGSGSNGGSKFVSQNEDVAAIANFSGAIGVITGGNEVSATENYFWGVYPYSTEVSCDGECVTASLPAQQVATAGTFADDLFLTVGKAKGLKLAFYNVCGGIKFAVSQPGVKYVTFRGNNGETLAGKARIGFGSNNRPVVSEVIEGQTELTLAAPDGGTFEVGETYFFVAFPAVLSSGYTMTFHKSSEEGVKTSTKSVEIKRSTFGNLKEADIDVNYIDYVQFPDANLKSYILANYDDDEDGRISMDEAANVSIVNCANRQIVDLSGLERCTNLTYINCSQNNIKYIDIPTLPLLETLSCYGNPIERLDISNATALKMLYLQDVNTNAISGTGLKIDKYTQASTLKFKFANTKFTGLTITNSTVLDDIDINDNIQLTSLSLNGNSKLEGIDISALIELTTLNIYSCALKSLNVDTNVKLKSFKCYSNALTELFVDKNVLLETFDCHANQLPTINVTNNTLLKVFDISSNKLVSLNIRNNTALTDLNVYSNKGMTTLNVTYNTALKNLKAYDLAISDINLKNNSVLATADLRKNKALTSIIVRDGFTRSALPIEYDHNTVATGLYDQNGALVEKFYIAQYVSDWGQGVVFSFSGNSSARMMSMDQYTGRSQDWLDSHQGGGWAFITYDDCSKIESNLNIINNAISFNGGTSCYGYYYTFSSSYCLGGSSAYYTRGAKNIN